MRNAVLSSVLVAVFLLCAPTAVVAQTDEDIRRELEELKRGHQEMQRQMALDRRIDELVRNQQAIQKQLEELKTLLQARPSAAAAPAAPGSGVRGMAFDLADNAVKGSASAPITLVEFTDYQCPFCSRFNNDTLPQLTTEYLDTGKVRLALLDMPLESIHPQAFKAAEASECAKDQDKFWQMHDRLFAHQKALEPWSGHAEAIGLDVATFDDCMSSDKYAESVRTDLALAQKAGVTGTPSFVVARTDPNDPSKVTGISFIRGAQAFNAFKAAIDGALDAGE